MKPPERVCIVALTQTGSFLSSSRAQIPRIVRSVGSSFHEGKKLSLNIAKHESEGARISHVSVRQRWYARCEEPDSNPASTPYSTLVLLKASYKSAKG